jgi:hypothetical protein
LKLLAAAVEVDMTLAVAAVEVDMAIQPISR